MSWIDWGIVLGYLLWIVWAGIRYGRKKESLEEYLLANRSLPWWAIGLSVMATQMSAVTLVGTTGQAFDDGMRFLQFYLGLPLAMIILSITVVPFFFRSKVYTAYEYLEKRFDSRTRSTTSFFFLVSRGLSVGVILSAPAVVLSVVLGWPEWITIFAMGLATTAYTMFGGVRAVTWTDVRQMVVVGAALGAVVIVIVNSLPDGISVGDALRTASLSGHIDTIDTSFNWNEKYTIWSGLIGGLFLFLAYFGTDQSQVQRYLTARSVSEGRASLMMSAFLKIPLQFLILLIGVLVFLFYHYNDRPVIFHPVEEERLVGSDFAERYAEIREEFQGISVERREAAIRLSEAPSRGERELAEDEYRRASEQLTALRAEVTSAVEDRTATGSFSDVNYVFPSFVVNELPIGIVGLFIAAIFAAAMSSISSELNALSTATVIDFYRRKWRPGESDDHYLAAGRVSTVIWGIVACVVATYATDLGSLIEVVNLFGSFFYGSLLGVFVLAFGFKRARGRGAFWGLLSGIATVATLHTTEAFEIAFLWYNVIGCAVVVTVGLLLSIGTPSTSNAE